MELEYQMTKDMNATNASGLNLQNFKTNVRFFLLTRNHVIIFEKCHIFFTTLSPKTVFEKTKIPCSLIMNSAAFMSYFICIL